MKRDRELWDYLNKNLKYLPYYKKDKLELLNCRKQNLCKINGGN